MVLQLQLFEEYYVMSLMCVHVYELCYCIASNFTRQALIAIVTC